MYVTVIPTDRPEQEREKKSVMLRVAKVRASSARKRPFKAERRSVEVGSGSASPSNRECLQNGELDLGPEKMD